VQSATKVSPKLDFSEASDLVTVNKDGLKGTRIKSLKVTVDTSESRGSPGEIISEYLSAKYINEYTF
jgi:hypothetical protein